MIKKIHKLSSKDTTSLSCGSRHWVSLYAFPHEEEPCISSLNMEFSPFIFFLYFTSLPMVQLQLSSQMRKMDTTKLTPDRELSC